MGRDSINLLHLMFADDIILMGEVDQNTIDAIYEIINLFCSISGQKVNASKSRVLFSKNTGAEWKSKVSTTLGIEETTNLGKYPGFAMDMSQARSNSFNFLVDKVKENSLGGTQNSYLWQDELYLRSLYCPPSLHISCSVPWYPRRFVKAWTD